MTKPKTSIEKLENRTEKVKDLKSALIVSRWKWEEVRKESHKLWGLINHFCGFCVLGKCEKCPENVRKKCKELQIKIGKIEDELDEIIVSTQAFLDGLKY